MVMVKERSRLFNLLVRYQQYTCVKRKGNTERISEEIDKGRGGRQTTKAGVGRDVHLIY